MFQTVSFRHLAVDIILLITIINNLSAGSMICLGKNNYFRFNHPKEAARIKMENPNIRFSIVPDNIYPGKGTVKDLLKRAGRFEFIIMKDLNMLSRSGNI